VFVVLVVFQLYYGANIANIWQTRDLWLPLSTNGIPEREIVTSRNLQTNQTYNHVLQVHTPSLPERLAEYFISSANLLKGLVFTCWFASSRHF